VMVQQGPAGLTLTLPKGDSVDRIIALY
jgi:hypothetical protein